MLRGFFFENFHMNGKTPESWICGFLNSLIATEKAEYRPGSNVGEIMSTNVISPVNPV
jgi:hypothetical protein